MSEPNYPPTPRTDGEAVANAAYIGVRPSFARELERENHLLREQIRVADAAFNRLHREHMLLRMRLQEELDSLADYLVTLDARARDDGKRLTVAEAVQEIREVTPELLAAQPALRDALRAEELRRKEEKPC